MFNGRVRVGFGRGLFHELDAVKLSHDSAFRLALCASDASSCSIAEFDSKRRWTKQSFKSG